MDHDELMDPVALRRLLILAIREPQAPRMLTDVGAFFDAFHARQKELEERGTRIWMRFRAGDYRPGDGSALDMTDLNLSHTRWHGADIRGARFDRTVWEGADLTDCNFSGAHFTDMTASLMGDFLTISHCTGDYSIWHGAMLDGAVFEQECSFTQARFRGARLSRCNLRGATFTDADFTGARLEYCNLPQDWQALGWFAGADIV